MWPLNDEEPVPVAFPFQDNLFDKCCKNMKNKNEPIPRRIVLTSKGNIIAVTASGCLMYCTVLNGTQGNWNIEYQNAKLENYCLLEISPCRRYVALAGIEGDIFIFNGKIQLIVFITCNNIFFYGATVRYRILAF